MKYKYALFSYETLVPRRRVRWNKHKKYIEFWGSIYKFFLGNIPLAVQKRDVDNVNSFDHIQYDWLTPFAQTTRLETSDIPSIDDNNGRCDVIDIEPVAVREEKIAVRTKEIIEELELPVKKTRRKKDLSGLFTETKKKRSPRKKAEKPFPFKNEDGN